MLGLRKPISIRYILWGHGIMCNDWARMNNIRRYNYVWIPAHQSCVDALRGVEGPIRNPDSPHRLVILPGYGWDGPTEEELEMAWVMGFDTSKCIVRK